jgi:sugar-phosphatase
LTRPGARQICGRLPKIFSNRSATSRAFICDPVLKYCNGEEYSQAPVPGNIAPHLFMFVSCSCADLELAGDNRALSYPPHMLAHRTPAKMTQITCAALLFDMDGVLINSTPAVARVWRSWAIEHGFNPEDVVARAHGRPSLTTVKEYLPDADHQAENREVERREIEDLDGVVPLPGALQLLASLPEDHWTIVTSCTRALAEVRIKAAGLPLPRKLITSNDIVHGKPDPEPYLKGASTLGFPPADCVVLEDVPAGIRSGKAAGARVIAFRTTDRETALREAGADWILNNCSDIRLLEASGALKLNLAVNR